MSQSCMPLVNEEHGQCRNDVDGIDLRTAKLVIHCMHTMLCCQVSHHAGNMLTVNKLQACCRVEHTYYDADLKGSMQAACSQSTSPKPHRLPSTEPAAVGRRTRMQTWREPSLQAVRYEPLLLLMTG